jgi:hypothetical protein
MKVLSQAVSIFKVAKAVLKGLSKAVLQDREAQTINIIYFMD